MTKEEFKAKAKYVLDNEMFLENENLFNYEDLNSIKVAQIDSERYIEALMPFMNYIDKLYEHIKGDLK